MTHSPVGVTPLADASGTPVILMCPPDYFTVEYAINPWMENIPPCNVPLAKKQWETLYHAITEQAGAKVLLMEPVDGLPDLVFTANAAFVYNDKAIIARYKHAERRGEEPHCLAWFETQGFETVTLPEGIFFEGAGDALVWEQLVFAGYRTRTDSAAHSLLTAATGLPVLSMELIDPRFYHIDVCLCPLPDGYLIYSPEAFDFYGNLVLENNVPAEKRIPVTTEEAGRFACNAVSIGQTVLFHEGSPYLTGMLKERGFHVIPVDLSEFLKSGGSAKCLTLRVG